MTDGTTPTDGDFDNMAHALGRPDGPGTVCYRNRFCVDKDGPTAQRFHALGWWTQVTTINGGRDAIFVVNEAGKAALAEHMGQGGAAQPFRESR